MTDLELVDAERFADALETIEAGAEPDLDPREDPTLTSLASLASEIRDVERFAAETPRFESYRTRSRAYVLRSTERPAPVAVLEEPRRSGIPFLRWSFLAPVASAAAAAVAVLAFVALQQDSPAAQPAGQQVAAVESPSDTPTLDAAVQVPDGGIGPTGAAPADATQGGVTPVELPPIEIAPIQPGQEEQFVAISIEQELRRIDALIVAVADRVALNQEVDPELLRGITESTAAVAERIEAQPDSVPWVQVIDYMKAAAHSETLLAAVRTDEGDEPALSAARRAAHDGVVVASNYFVQAR